MEEKLFLFLMASECDTQFTALKGAFDISRVGQLIQPEM